MQQGSKALIDARLSYLCSVNEEELLRRIRVIWEMDKVVG